VAETLSLCHFVFGPELAAVWAGGNGRSAGGRHRLGRDGRRIQRIGQRRVNLMRAFNAREGLTRADDILPEKLFKQALKGGRTDGQLLSREELAAGLAMYYEQAGWDPITGMPTRETLADLGLDWVADTLWALAWLVIVPLAVYFTGSQRIGTIRPSAGDGSSRCRGCFRAIGLRHQRLVIPRLAHPGLQLSSP
jgi:hypothetical protein